MGADAYLKLVNETFGDMENDNRKIALFMNLCQMILEFEVERFISSIQGEDYHLDFNLEPSSQFYIFVKLFIHLFYSSLINKKWVKYCLKRFCEGIDAEIWENENPSKIWKQNAIVFRDVVTLSGEID